MLLSVTCTEPPTPPIVDKLLRADCTCAAVAVNGNRDVVAPLKFNWNVPVPAPDRDTVCTSLERNPPRLLPGPTITAPPCTRVLPRKVLAVPSTDKLPMPTLESVD